MILHTFVHVLGLFTPRAGFITGSKSVEVDYDAFLNEIQKLGEEYLAIYQAAYAK